MAQHQIFHLKTEFITLSQLIKAAGIVDMGSDAKLLIQEGNILVNDEIEERRGRKIRAGDTVSLATGEQIEVV